jgi:UDPglucose--hexose-1-phosphate uridylyltransferase
VPELRKDPVTGRWVIIATERSKRPSDYTTLRVDPRPGVCPFCAGNESLTPEQVLVYSRDDNNPKTADWWVRVVPNKYPALSHEGEATRRGDGLYDLINGVGAHEVIIETPDHATPMAALPVEHIREVLWAYRERLIAHSKDPRIGYVLIFKNHGPAAGASLDHPHTQLIATPIVPVRVKSELEGADKYYKYKERNVFLDMITQEERKPRRIVEETEHFIAFEPFASRFPFETWILPRRHQPLFQMATEDEVMDLAGILKWTLGRIYNALEDPPFNFMLHVAPPGWGESPSYQWHLEIIPKLTTVAGFEWGSGFYINPTDPEDACRHLRNASPEVEPTAPRRVRHKAGV